MNNLMAIINRQKRFSEKTFGPGPRDAGLIDHISKELVEIEKAPGDLEEWIDVIILAMDGAWRNGYSAGQIVAMLNKKQTKNEKRLWPDWREADPGKAIEHIKKRPMCAKYSTCGSTDSYTVSCSTCSNYEAPITENKKE